MDAESQRDRYRRIVRDVLAPLVERRYSGWNAQNEVVFDETHDRYMVVTVGWEGNIRRIHRCLAHLDIINGKISI